MRRVTVDAPTRSRIDPKLGTDSAMKSRQRTENVLKAHRFQLKSEEYRDSLTSCRRKQILTCRDIEHLLKELSGGVGDDGEGGDEVEEQHDLHQHLHPPGQHRQHNVVLHLKKKMRIHEIK